MAVTAQRSRGSSSICSQSALKREMLAAGENGRCRPKHGSCPPRNNELDMMMMMMMMIVAPKEDAIKMGSGNTKLGPDESWVDSPGMPELGQCCIVLQCGFCLLII